MDETTGSPDIVDVAAANPAVGRTVDGTALLNAIAAPDTAGTVARANGWRGFDSIGERVDGGYLYGCDGMPTQMGCGAQIIVPRRLSRVGKKSTGWLVCYGQDFDGTDIKDVVLTFCPKCALVVSGAA